MPKLGLILFAGGNGSDKSTPMAALIDYRNQKSKGHIVTIEDSAESTHPHKGCIVSQREVGTDSPPDNRFNTQPLSSVLFDDQHSRAGHCVKD